MIVRLRSLLLLIFLALIMPSALAAEFAIPSFEQVRAAHVSSDALLLDRNGQVLTDLRIAREVRRLEWVPLASLSPAMQEALLRAEDHRFYEHSGVDWLAFAGAAWQNLWHHGKRGASTLTMQLAGLLDPALQMPVERGARRSYVQKWDQSRVAITLENKWSKSQILEAYLNLAPFRGDLQGVGAASQLLFGVAPNQISPREASLLAALLRGPNARPALVAQRACRLSATLGRPALCGEISVLAQSRLDAPRNQSRHFLAPHLAQALLQHPGQRIGSTLDGALQQRIETIMKRLNDPGAAAVVLDNASGDVLVWIGAMDPKMPDGIVQKHSIPAWTWPQQAALALDQRQLTLASPIPLGWAIFDSRDARAASTGWTSLRQSLQEHQAGAMAYVLNIDGHEPWLERLQGMGLEPAAPLDAWGGQDISLMQLAAAWRPFMAGGMYVAPRYLAAEPAAVPRRIWRPEAAFLLQEIYGALGSGGWQTCWQGRALDDNGVVFVGSTDRHTLALISHVAVQHNVMRGMLAVLDPDSRPPLAPDGVVAMQISYDPPRESARKEWFIRGTELSRISVLEDRRLAQIRFPQAGQQYSLARDAAQRGRWNLTAETAVALHWVLDGKPLAESDRQNWLPQPGKHILSIYGPLEQELDAVVFEVVLTDEMQEQSIEPAQQANKKSPPALTRLAQPH